MIGFSINVLRDRAYKIACQHGFHDKELSDKHLLMLVITELSEAVEADRSNRWNRRAKVDWFKKKIETSRICKGLDTEISKERGYEVAYNETIKGSIEEELADVAIRLLDLYGLRGIDLDEDVFDKDTIQSYAETYREKSFAESVFNIVRLLTSGRGTIKTLAVLPECLLLEIFGLAKHLEIDLLWHIEQKMRYNELREKMHGKKY